MSDIKIFALRADDFACGQYRVYKPAEYARREGVDITVNPDLFVESSHDAVTGDITIHDVTVEADVIIFQRPVLGAFTDAIKVAQAKGIACVVEIDDDMSTVHRDNAAWDEVDPAQNPRSNWRHMINAAHQADWVTCSTPALARKYAPHGRVSVIRNVVTADTFDIQKTVSSPPRVGWTGSWVTHPGDLETVGPHIGTVLRNTGGIFSMLGDDDHVRKRLAITPDMPYMHTPWVDLSEYRQTLANVMDIGIVPLEDSQFNDAKSYLKGLEMAAVGIPFIASPSEEYRLLAEMGVGKLATRGVEWQKYIKQLVVNRDYLLEEGARVRDAVRGLTYENTVGMWIDAWENAAKYRRSQKTSA